MSGKGRKSTLTGFVFLGFSILLCAGAQLLLKRAMADVGGVPSLAALAAYLPELIRVPVIAGLSLYGIGTALWLGCLTRLDLSVAYPASALQFLLIFAGAWWLFDESVNLPRIVGAVIVLAGVLMLTLDRRETAAEESPPSGS